MHRLTIPQQRNNRAPQTFEVLVVGAGPGGLATAVSLAREGIRTLLVERHPGTTIFPRATGVSTRSMELFRQWGIEDDIRAGSIPVEPKITIARTLAEPGYGSFEFGYPTDEEALAISPVTPIACPQDHLEPVLLDRFLELGGTAYFNTELVDFTTSEGDVRAELRDRRTGMRSSVQARYLVGADGPRSTVRRRLGIETESHGVMGEFICVLFTADLSAVAPRPTPVLYVVEEPDGGAVIVPTDGANRWVYGRQWDPDTASADEFDRETCIDLIRTSTGIPNLTPEILEIMPVTFGADTAKAFRKGVAFLVGDAAHRMTPVGGLGMNTAIADGHNLAWKLAWALKGWAADALLDSYEPERLPVGRYNALRSLQRGEKERVEGLTQDLGMPYRSDAVINGDSNADIGHPWESAVPGGRAPHAWVEVDGKPMSTVDLFDGGLTLLTGPAGLDWREAALELSDAGQFPMRVFTVGYDIRAIGTALSDRYRLSPRGAVLIRPDGHVVWHSHTASAAAASVLRHAVGNALGRAAAFADPVPVKVG